LRSKKRKSVPQRSPPTATKKSKVVRNLEDFEEEEEEDSLHASGDVRRNSRGLPLTPTGRPSIKLNEVNRQFTPKYHSRGNTKTLLGKSMSLGGSMALLATIRHGPLLPTDEHGHEARARLFCDALTYALTEEEAREIMDSSDAAFRLYLKGLMLAGTFKLRCDLPVTARAHFQNMVFHVARKTKEIQDHLGLQMHESILDQ